MQNKPRNTRKNDLNEFTNKLKAKSLNQNKSIICELHDGSLRRVKFRPANEEDDTEDMFVSSDRHHEPDWEMLWELNGSSVTSHDYDIVFSEFLD